MKKIVYTQPDPKKETKAPQTFVPIYGDGITHPWKRGNDKPAIERKIEPVPVFIPISDTESPSAG